MSIRKSKFPRRNTEFVKRDEKTGMFCTDSTKSAGSFLSSLVHIDFRQQLIHGGILTLLRGYHSFDPSRFLICSGSSSGIISFVMTCSISSSFARSSAEKRSSKRFTTSSRNW